LLIDTDVFGKVKAATVAIGLSNRNTGDIISSFGTGFFIDEKYIVTSAHVFTQCIKYNNYYKEKNKGVEGVYSAFNITSNGDQKSNSYNIERAIRLPPLKEATGFTGSIDLDLGIGKLDHCSDKFLPIRHSSRLKLYEDIAMCGYPSGRISLILYKNNHKDAAGIRLNPIIQFGHIAGLIPTDDNPRPWGIQTDIIAMGGSSGSPIVDMKSEVLGMAQDVIATMTTVDEYGMPPNLYELTKGPLYGVAPIGLAYGVSNQILSLIPNIAKNYFEKNLPPDLLFQTNEVLELF
jgi:V8-like Glu-specific endopeptidase